MRATMALFVSFLPAATYNFAEIPFEGASLGGFCVRPRRQFSDNRSYPLFSWKKWPPSNRRHAIHHGVTDSPSLSSPTLSPRPQNQHLWHSQGECYRHGTGRRVSAAPGHAIPRYHESSRFVIASNRDLSQHWPWYCKVAPSSNGFGIPFEWIESFERPPAMALWHRNENKGEVSSVWNRFCFILYPALSLTPCPLFSYSFAIVLQISYSSIILFHRKLGKRAQVSWPHHLFFQFIQLFSIAHPPSWPLILSSAPS